MLSHFLLMVALRPAGVSLFFTLLWRRERREQVGLFLQIFLGMVGGGLLVAWLMYPFPSGRRRPSHDGPRAAMSHPASCWSSPGRPRGTSMARA